jgi:hypothetical protein
MMVNFPAWLAPLADFNQGLTDPEPVTYLNTVFGHFEGRDILSKPAQTAKMWMRLMAGLGKVCLPQRIMFAGVEMYRLVLSAMHGRIAYAIALESGEGQINGSVDRTP